MRVRKDPRNQTCRSHAYKRVILRSSSHSEPNCCRMDVKYGLLVVYHTIYILSPMLYFFNAFIVQYEYFSGETAGSGQDPETGQPRSVRRLAESAFSARRLRRPPTTQKHCFSTVEGPTSRDMAGSYNILL